MKRPPSAPDETSRLEAVLSFTSFFARQMPLVALLDAAPARIAKILGADVCSIYVREGDGQTLVMRGNVGYGRAAIGTVQLSVGEGITGTAVSTMHPTRADLAHEHAKYKHFAELGEERYPVFLAVPIPGRVNALGAVVVQRAHGRFSDEDVERLMLMSALIAASIRTADLLDERRERPTRKAGGGTRKVTLTGRPIVGGRALGAAAALRRPAQRPSAKMAVSGTAEEESRLRGAFDVADKSLRSIAAHARALSLGREAAFLQTYVEILDDQRFRERALELVVDGGGIPNALGQVAREVTRTAAAFTRDPFLEERAKDVEDLCDALSMIADVDKRAELPSKAILVGDGLTVFDLLVSARTHPVGIVLTERATSPRTGVLLRLLDVPALVGVEGLFRWMSDGDIALVDGDHGLIIVNPSKSEIASLRQSRRD